jgi:6-phosphogluconolactonase
MNSNNRGEIFVLPDAAEAAEEAARRFVDISGEAIVQRGRFSVVLSGGSTPRVMHKLLTRPPLRDRVDWRKVYVFWSDERFVPPDNSESNFRMARETLLDHVPIPKDNIRPVPTGTRTPEEAAQRYTETLKNFFQADIPTFDLVILGMGPDGHTASLFPGYPELQLPHGTLVAALTNAPKPPPTRITLTLPAINSAANVVFLVTGSDKAKAVKSVLEGTGKLPAKKVQPVEGKLIWLLDKAAAHLLLET